MSSVTWSSIRVFARRPLWAGVTSSGRLEGSTRFAVRLAGVGGLLLMDKTSLAQCWILVPIRYAPRSLSRRTRALGSDVVFFHDVNSNVLQVLRENISQPASFEIYSSEKAVWRAEADTIPCIRSPSNDRDKQDVLFQTAENVCKGLEKVPKDDYRAYVSHTFPSHTRSQPLGRFVHISFVAFTGILPSSLPGTCFLSGHPTLLKL